jgi:hypothetical protein
MDNTARPTTRRRPGRSTQPTGTKPSAAGRVSAPESGDLLVFELHRGTLRLVGGRGRGSSWAGVVEAGIEDEPMVRRAVRGSVPVRVREEEPVRVLGPYWSRHAALVAVGDDHVVVIGDDDAPLRASDGELRRQAAEAVSRVGGIPSSCAPRRGSS